MKTFFKRGVAALLMAAMLVPTLAACQSSTPTETSATVGTTTALTTGATNKKPSNNYPTTPNTPAVKNLDWPEDQIFPTFPAGSGTIDVIMGKDISEEEKQTFGALQGLVNAKETRMAVYIDNVEKWANQYGYKAVKATSRSDRDALVLKYASPPQHSPVCKCQSRTKAECGGRLGK